MIVIIMFSANLVSSHGMFSMLGRARHHVQRASRNETDSTQKGRLSHRTSPAKAIHQHRVDSEVLFTLRCASLRELVSILLSMGKSATPKVVIRFLMRSPPKIRNRLSSSERK